ncbi:MAG: adenylosuccinate lyase [Clostridia bacterium]|nr:adenylosuccinate lyase [Clostridia bacterium]
MSDRYVSPFESRYASREMRALFSPEKKFTTFRRLWVALARAEKAMGVDISDGQIKELEEHVDDLDLEKARAYEKELRHDVMAQIRAYGDVCPTARPIIHLGATSCYVGDNTDIIIMREALALLRGKLLTVLRNLKAFALAHKDLPCLAYTHLQPAQLTTVGKRAALWAYDLTLDLADLDALVSSMKLLGSKGTTGTQASFSALFDGDAEKVKKAEEMIAKELGFDAVVPVSGQTYSRKTDSRVMNVLSGIAQSAHKFANDLRILQSFKELEEPFEKYQVGSSAMPYKRNPMRCERMTALARYAVNLAQNAAQTACEQWMERTLDDSANRRLTISEGFLAVDAVLDLYINITSGIVVYPKMIARRVSAELPFMATENVLMNAVARGGDRQDLHERLRLHSMAAGKRVKEEGLDNDLIDRICADPAFGVKKEELSSLLKPENYTGLAAGQTEEFFERVVDPLLKSGQAIAGGKIEV